MTKKRGKSLNKKDRTVRKKVRSLKKSEDIFDKCQKVGFITKDGEWYVYEDETPAEQVGFFPEWQYGKDPRSNTGGGMIEHGWYDEEDGEPDPEPWIGGEKKTRK